MLTAFRVAYENATGTITDFRNKKVLIKSMCLDIHIVNNGSNGLEFDVYQVIMRKDWSASSRIDVMFTGSFDEQATATGYTRVVSTPGVTPFQSSNFCEHFKILSKRSILLGAGQATSLQLRISKARMFDGKVLERNTAGIPRYTKGYLFVVKGVPTVVTGTVRRAAGSFIWTQERTMTVARHADGQQNDIAATQ